jgi:hypothetical protein
VVTTTVLDEEAKGWGWEGRAGCPRRSGPVGRARPDKSGRELADAGADLTWVETPETEEQAFHVTSREHEVVERHGFHAMRGGRGLGLTGRETADESRRRVQTRLDRRDLHQSV